MEILGWGEGAGSMRRIRGVGSIWGINWEGQVESAEGLRGLGWQVESAGVLVGSVRV